MVKKQGSQPVKDITPTTNVTTHVVFFLVSGVVAKPSQLLTPAHASVSVSSAAVSRQSQYPSLMRSGGSSTGNLLPGPPPQLVTHVITALSLSAEAAQYLTGISIISNISTIKVGLVIMVSSIASDARGGIPAFLTIICDRWAQSVVVRDC